jgi:hypothetical protein
MKNRTRMYYSESQKALMWDRWQKGDSLHDIARLFDRGHSAISRILGETGSIRDLAESFVFQSLVSRATHNTRTPEVLQ